jgi:hypothetical protein
MRFIGQYEAANEFNSGRIADPNENTAKDTVCPNNPTHGRGCAKSHKFHPLSEWVEQ